jgi:hypothetical protein
MSGTAAAKMIGDPERESSTVELRGNLGKKDRAALKNLRRLEGDEEASLIYFEAAEAVASGHRKKSLKIEKYMGDVFPSKPLTYPLLFSSAQKVQMSRSELMTEIALIMTMAKRDWASGPHIYSIQVLEPKNLGGFVNPEKLGEYLGGSIPPDMKSGYIYGPLLYGLPQFVRSVALEGILGNATEIEIALRNPSTPALERKKVTLG